MVGDKHSPKDHVYKVEGHVCYGGAESHSYAVKRQCKPKQNGLPPCHFLYVLFGAVAEDYRVKDFVKSNGCKDNKAEHYPHKFGNQSTQVVPGHKRNSNRDFADDIDDKGLDKGDFCAGGAESKTPCKEVDGNDCDKNRRSSQNVHYFKICIYYADEHKALCGGGSFNWAFWNCL